MTKVKLWVDDIRPAPGLDYVKIKSVNHCIQKIQECEAENIQIEYLDLDHDAGDYYTAGGNYIKILDWLEATGRVYDIKIHTANPVGAENMRRIIQRNNWKEIR